ncbi:MAG: TlpA family protein disulfide reductase [Polaribacter sp.]
MKKILAILLLVSSFAHAQFTIHGTMSPVLDSDWVILYKIESAKQIFVQNTTIKKDSVTINGKKHFIGTFEFKLPKNTKPGSYRITYRTEKAGFVDFIFNKENVYFTFHPDYPELSITFSSSKENILYKKYVEEISSAQQTLDSLQIKALKNPNVSLKKTYKKDLQKLNAIQKKYLNASKGMYSQPFIKATLRANSPELQTTSQAYMSNINTTFFDHINFSDKTLLNSSFLLDRISDYVFYINYSDNLATQKKLFKKSITTVFSKIESATFKKDVIKFLIDHFETSKNLEMIDYLFENYYDKLPDSVQDKEYKTKKLSALATEVGRVAPNFSWTENGKTQQLSTLKEATNYVLVFWSAECSHCLREIPQLYAFMKNHKNIKVVAFALEREKTNWKNYIKKLSGWHHVLGLKKWENNIARKYNIVATPTYFVLDSNKKIIAKPRELKDIETFIKKLK